MVLNFGYCRSHHHQVSIDRVPSALINRADRETKLVDRLVVVLGFDSWNDVANVDRVDANLAAERRPVVCKPADGSTPVLVRWGVETKRVLLALGSATEKVFTKYCVTAVLGMMVASSPSPQPSCAAPVDHDAVLYPGARQAVRGADGGQRFHHGLGE